MSISPVHLTSHEFTVTIRFCGADVGKFPASIPSNPDVTFKSNSVRFGGGQQLAAFSTAQDLAELHRIIKNDPSLSISSNLAIPSALITQYQTNGPLVQVTVTGNNQLDAGANITMVYKGIMALPDISFLDNPGTIDLQIMSYGEAPTITQAGL
jgi:hypothetical protein